MSVTIPDSQWRSMPSWARFRSSIHTLTIGLQYLQHNIVRYLLDEHRTGYLACKHATNPSFRLGPHRLVFEDNKIYHDSLLSSHLGVINISLSTADALATLHQLVSFRDFSISIDASEAKATNFRAMRSSSSRFLYQLAPPVQSYANLIH